MASTHSWHPGSPALNSCWTFNIPIHPDELLSSWLIRIALKHSTNPLSLTGEIWPNFRAWTIDLDRNLSDQKLHKLSLLSGVPFEAISRVLLKNYASHIIADNFLPKGNWPWILSIGSRNRKHSSGAQICPKCLNTLDPYYKVQWRFAWHTICEVHRTPLIQRCPHCHTLINPTNLKYYDQTISICYQCKKPLSEFENNHPVHSPSLDLALEFQQETDNVLRKREASAINSTLSVQEWFQLNRFLINITKKSPIRLKNEINPHIPINTTSTQTGLAIEMLSTQDRLSLLSCVQKLLTMPPSELISQLNHSISPSELHDPRILMPEFLKKHFQRSAVSTRKTNLSHITPTSFPPPKSPTQVKRKWARLMRKYYLDYENMR